MKKFNILIPDLIPPPARIEQDIFGSKVKIITPQAMKNADVPDEIWARCDGILAYDKITYHKDLLSKLKRCKAIVRAGIGVDNIDLKEAQRKNICVCNVPDYCKGEVADHTFALLLSLVRGVCEHVKQTQRGMWERMTPIAIRLEGKVFGIIGMGRIGKEAAERAIGFGMKVIYYDPWRKETKGLPPQWKRVKSLLELAKKADIISIHTPLTSDTQHMINGKFFQHTKKGIFLINSARGPIIDLKALKGAMKKGIVAGCGIDALPTEFPGNAYDLIQDYQKDKDWLKGRLIMTPHAAFYSKEAFRELRAKAAEEGKRVLDGQRPLNCVNNFLGDSHQKVTVTLSVRGRI